MADIGTPRLPPQDEGPGHAPHDDEGLVFRLARMVAQPGDTRAVGPRLMRIAFGIVVIVGPFVYAYPTAQNLFLLGVIVMLVIVSVVVFFLERWPDE